MRVTMIKKCFWCFDNPSNCYKCIENRRKNALKDIPLTVIIVIVLIIGLYILGITST